jgi:hypothetical protein
MKEKNMRQLAMVVVNVKGGPNVAVLADAGAPMLQKMQVLL